MADPHVLTALRRKYGVILGELRHTEKNATRLKADLLHVAAVIHLFRQDENVQAIKPINPQAQRVVKGRIWATTAREVMRAATEPMTAHDIAGKVADLCGVDPAGRKARRDIQCSVHVMLRNDMESTVTRYGGKPARWSINRGATGKTEP